MLNPKSLSAACVLMTSVTAFAGPCDTCTADIDDGTRTGTLDGGVTIEDLLYFLELFSDGNIRICTWCACYDPTPTPGEPSCCQTIDVLLFYLTVYLEGC